MDNNECKTCINRKICVEKNSMDCDHYDVTLTRSEVLNILDDLKGKNPQIVPTILDAVKKTYKINLAY